MIALSAKYKLGMIDGALPKHAATSPYLNHWIRCNDMVISWLLNSVSAEIRNSIVYLLTAKLIWDDLATSFSQSNVPLLFYLQKEIAYCVQGSLSITGYFTKFRTLIDELDNLSSIPRCVCAACTCEVSQKIEQYEQGLKLSQFFMGLNENYISIRGQILLMNHLPSLNQAYSLLLQEENQRETPNIHRTTSDSTAMSVKHHNFTKPTKFTGIGKKLLAVISDKSGDATLGCSYCHQDKHTRDKCFFLHGYPPWHRLYGQPKPKLKSYNKNSASAAQVSLNANHETEQVIKQSSTSESVASGGQETVPFSEAQCQQIMQLIQAGMKNISPWSAPHNGAHLAGTYLEEETRDW